jgi:lantibiotic modifying enzyme
MAHSRSRVVTCSRGGLALLRRRGPCDFLTEAAARLGRSELLTVAQDAATALIERVGLRGRCDSGWDEKRAWQVVLFHGAPGVGYSLLRVGHPTILPSVLLWS